MSAAERARLISILEKYMSPRELAPVVEMFDQADTRAWNAGWHTGYSSAMATVRGELGAAVGQTLPSDDQVVAGHVKTAYVLAGGRA